MFQEKIYQLHLLFEHARGKLEADKVKMEQHFEILFACDRSSRWLFQQTLELER